MRVAVAGAGGDAIVGAAGVGVGGEAGAGHFWRKVCQRVFGLGNVAASKRRTILQL